MAKVSKRSVKAKSFYDDHGTFTYKGRKPGFYEDNIEIQERFFEKDLDPRPFVRDWNLKKHSGERRPKGDGRFEGRKQKYTYSNINYVYFYDEVIHHSHKRRKYVIGREEPLTSEKWPGRIHCTRWIDEEWSAAFLMHEKGMSFDEIRKILGRTCRSVSEKFYRMKKVKVSADGKKNAYHVEGTVGKRWNPFEFVMAKNLRNAGKTDAFIADVLRRSEASVKRKFAYESKKGGK